MSRITSSSLAKLCVLTPAYEGVSTILAAEMAQLCSLGATWYVCPNGGMKGEDRYPLATVLPLRFPADRPPLLACINQAREVLRLAAVGSGAESVLWVDADMEPTATALLSLRASALQGRYVIAPLMRNRHAARELTCAWVVQGGGVEVRGLRYAAPAYRVLPMENPTDGRFVRGDGVGLGCVAHHADLLRRVSFTAGAASDDVFLSTAAREQGYDVLVDYGNRVGHAEEGQ